MKRLASGVFRLLSAAVALSVFGACGRLSATAIDAGQTWPDAGQDAGTGDFLDVGDAGGSDAAGPDGACDREGDCREAEQCFDGECRPLPGCETDQECEGTQVCNPFTGQCVIGKACDEDTDCRFSQLCISGHCISFPRCGTDADCTAGDYCKDGSCVLVPACRIDGECLAGERCDFGYCQPVRCGSDADCRSGWYCTAEICFPHLYCMRREDCPAPERMECSLHECAGSDGCRGGSDCGSGNVCLAGACMPWPLACGTDADCGAAEVCNFGQCWKRPDCQIDADCDEDFRCVDGECKPPKVQCADDWQCPRGYRCQEGKCKVNATCEDSSACSELFKCVMDRCRYSGPCDGVEECPAGFDCVSGWCAPPAPCESDDSCPEGTACVDRQCRRLPECEADDGCREGMYCNGVDGRCRIVPACGEGEAGCDAPPDGPGPFPVGVVTRSFRDVDRDRELVTEIWYPAAESARAWPHDMFDLYGGIPPLDTGAVREAPGRDGEPPFPVAFYSHGAYGVAQQFFELCVRLASHGYVVAAPNHAGDTYLDEIDENRDVRQVTIDRVKDVTFVLDRLADAASDPSDILFGMADASNSGGSGLCYGGDTVLLASWREGRLKAVSPHSPSGIGSVGDRYFSALTLPVGLLGGEVDPDPNVASMVRAYRLLPGASFLVELAAAGHIHPSNVCDFDPYNVEACGPDMMPPRRAKDLTMAYTTAFFDYHLKGEAGAAEYLTAERAAAIPDILYWSRVEGE